MFNRLTAGGARRSARGGLSSSARGAIVGVVVSTVVLGSATAYAGSGIGGVFNLGKTNSVNATTTLTGSTSGRMLNVVNKGTGPGLGVTVGAGAAPIAVSPGAGKAVNLDADKLDGLEATAFLGVGAQTADSDQLDGRDSTAFLGVGAQAADSDLLDGRDSTSFLGVTAKATDSDRLDGIDSTGFLRSTAKAVDADRLDGIDSTGFLRSTAKAVDADQLDGIDSSVFVRGPGQILRGARAIPKDDIGLAHVISTVNPSLWVGYGCPSDLSHPGPYAIFNEGNELVNMFVDNGGEAPQYVQLEPGDRYDRFASAAGEHLTVQVQGANMATLELFSVHRSAKTTGDCHVQAMAVLSR